jgi:hypothetical protein
MNDAMQFERAAGAARDRLLKGASLHTQDADPGEEIWAYLEKRGDREVMAIGSTRAYRTSGQQLITVNKNGQWWAENPQGKKLGRGTGLAALRAL